MIIIMKSKLKILLYHKIQYYIMSSKSSHSSRRRNITERVKAIFTFINAQIEPFPKSRFKDIGLNPQAAEKWLSLIEYIQKKPKIRVVRTSHNTIIEKVEGNYLSVIRARITDESLSFEERQKSMDDYLKALYAREKLEIERLAPDLRSPRGSQL